MIKMLTAVFSFLMLSSQANAQIVINEILYNIPSTGENEEFIELYNAGSTPVDMTNYTLQESAVVYTFGNTTLNGGDYFVVARDSAAFQTSFGFAADAEGSISLSNSGEDIMIYNASGVLVDSVDYETSTPWPTAASGLGRSLQLCDATTDNNLGANWGTNNTATGLNGTTGVDSLYATPGALNECVTVAPPSPSSYPVYSFSQINDIDASGLIDSINVTCELRGIAYCENYRVSQTGYDFPFASSDNSAGVRVFTFNDVSAYSFTDGDSLHISGTVSQFRGLLQFSPDSITLISSGNAGPSAMTVTSLDETTENKFVRFENVYLADTAQWTTGAGFGFNVDVTNGNDTFDLRIDSDITDLFNLPTPLGNFTLTGWGGQRDQTSPYLSDYQLLPCSNALVLSASVLQAKDAQIKVYPNPSSSILNIDAKQSIQKVQLYNAIGQIVISKGSIQTNNLQLNIEQCAKGLYLLVVESNGSLSSQQIIVE